MDVTFVRTQVREWPEQGETEPKGSRSKKEVAMKKEEHGGDAVATVGVGVGGVLVGPRPDHESRRCLCGNLGPGHGPLEMECGAYHCHQNHRHLCFHLCQKEKQTNRTNLP